MCVKPIAPVTFCKIAFRCKLCLMAVVKEWPWETWHSLGRLDGLRQRTPLFTSLCTVPIVALFCILVCTHALILYYINRYAVNVSLSKTAFVFISQHNQ